MKALLWHGQKNVSVDVVPDPVIEDAGDAVIRVTSTAICGSDLHIYNGYVPMMKEGDILGHEFMGEVVEIGANVKNLKKGDRVVVPFTIACGHCHFCDKDLFGLCDNSNPDEEVAKKQLGHSPSGMFGYSHMLGGFSGGQAEYVRVPFADVGPIVIPEGLNDERVLFLSDILPTGYMAAEHCDIEPGDTVAVWGCGPVGQFSIQSAWLLGAKRVIAIDHIPERLELARRIGKAETIDTVDADEVYEKLMQMTGGMGPECCIDAVGAEAHGTGMVDMATKEVREHLHIQTPRIYALEQIVKCCKKGGKISVPGVYLGAINGFSFGTLMNKGLSVKTGQTNVQHYLKPLLNMIVKGTIDPSAIITHRMKLEDAPKAYDLFNEKKDGCIKVVLQP